jgi:transcription antitermination factor NusG
LTGWGDAWQNPAALNLNISQAPASPPPFSRRYRFPSNKSYPFLPSLVRSAASGRGHQYDGSPPMPVLDREPAVWPEDLFARSPELAGSAEWRAYHVRPRSEKAVARHLRTHNISYYLPQIERRRRYQRREVRSHLVLFPGYVFILQHDPESARRIDYKAMIRSLTITDQSQIDRELRDIHRLIQSGQPLTREERLQTGSLARIVRGPLAGLCGHVVRNKRGQKFVLNVQFLQQGVSVAIDVASIEAL